jgi:hypothetical protein
MWAEKVPGFAQSPDFCIPHEMNPAVVIEAKIMSDGGTARDKVARIKELETQHNRHVAEGWPHYEVVTCIDGRQRFCLPPQSRPPALRPPGPGRILHRPSPIGGNRQRRLDQYDALQPVSLFLLREDS